MKKIMTLLLAALLLSGLVSCRIRPISEEKAPEPEITFADGIVSDPVWMGEAAAYAKDVVAERIRGLWDSARVAVTAAEITGLTTMNTGTVGLWDGINMYLLEYRLTPKDPSSLPADGSVVTDSGRITEADENGQPYLLLHFLENGDGSVTWTRVTVTNEKEIETRFDTPEMLEKYGDNPYTAACMELYEETK